MHFFDALPCPGCLQNQRAVFKIEKFDGVCLHPLDDALFDSSRVGNAKRDTLVQIGDLGGVVYSFYACNKRAVDP